MKSPFSHVSLALLLTLALAPAATAAPPPPTLAEVLARAAGSPTVPAAWAGVWEVSDSVHACGSSVITDTAFEVDTLCTGDFIVQEEEGYDCVVNAVNDTQVDVVCSFTEEIEKGCEVLFQYSVVGTRSGDTYHVETSFSTVFTPPLCAFIPDQCETSEHTGVRIAPEPSECTSPVESNSWGRIKASYR